MEKSFVYIYERKYESNSEKVSERKKGYGENLVQNIYKNRKEIRGYLDEQNWKEYCEFDLNKYKKNMKNIKEETKIVVRHFLKESSDNFDRVYEIFMMVAYEQFLERLKNEKNIYTEGFINAFLEQLLKQLRLISIRVLIYEIHEKNNTKR